MEGVQHDVIIIRQSLPLRVKFAYGVGHVLNDVCASMWFTYLLVYFNLVLKFDSFLSGVLLLIGQVADAIATPFVGLESDKVDDFWLCRYGRRKSWHLVGTVCVLVSFPFIFMPCLHCEGSHQWARLIYYAVLVVIFQFGWASGQISHLSLIPDLTYDDNVRTELTAIRYGFTVFSNILIYVTTWAILHVTNDSEEDRIGPKDKHKFQNIVFIGIAVGSICCILFHLGVKEPSAEVVLRARGRSLLGNGCNSTGQNSRRRMSAVSFLQEHQFYQIALLYMSTRLFVNLTQVYIPMYLHVSLDMRSEALAIIPLIMFLSSFLVSFFVKFLNERLGRKWTYMIGCLLGISGCVWIWFGSGSMYRNYELYGVAFLLGAGSSVTLVTSLGITADLIGPNTESGAFVYGAMSFTDKLSNGIAVAVIQHFQCITLCSNFYRNVLTFVCGGSATFGLVVLVSLSPFTIGSRRMKDIGTSPYQRIGDRDSGDAQQSDENSVTVQSLENPISWTFRED